MASAPPLQAAVYDAVADSDHLLIDLSETEFIDLAIVHELVSAERLARRHGIRFNLVLGTRPIVERALQLTNVLPLPNRVESVEDALS